MADPNITRATGEQVRFISALTGDHVLDAYLEACEKGGRTLYDLLDDLFNPDGSKSLGLFSRWAGNWATGTAYLIGDGFRDPATDNLYQVSRDHVASSLAADLAAGNIFLVFDAAAVRADITASAAAAQAAQAAAETAQGLAEDARAAAQGYASAAASDAASVASALASIGQENVDRVSANTTLTVASNKHIVTVNAAAGQVVVTLPLGAAIGEPGSISVQKIDSTAHTVLVRRQGTDTINGGTADYELATQYQGAQFSVDLDVDPDDWAALPFGAGAVGGVRVSANDTTAAPLSSKLVAGYGIAFTEVGDGGNETFRADVTVQVPGLFYKADPDSVTFTKTAAGAISLKAGTKVEVAGAVVSFVSDTAVTMPSLTAGTDYAVYVCSDGTVRADASFSAPTGYTTANSRKIGGFHYALGNLNVDATPNINAYSLWDLKWRPACADPRGMVLVAGNFWADIYLLGVNHHTDGTSKAGVTIADGSSPPKVSPLFGGNGTTDYGSLTWHEAAEVMASHGKSLLSYGEFSAAAYGVTEASSAGSDPVTTKRSANYTSKWGLEQATGCMWQWGREFGGTYGAAAWTANTEGRGSTYTQASAAIFGGNWGHAANSGSRFADWHNAPSYSGNDVGARGRCDHLRLV